MTRSFALSIVWLYVAVTPSWADKLVLFAGGGKGGDGVPATQALLTQPFGIDFDGDGNAYIVELSGERVLKVDTKGILHVAAGTHKKKGSAGDGGPGKDATFNGMHALAHHPSGKLFLADTWNGRVRTYDPKTSNVESFAGSNYLGGTKKWAYAGDGGPAKDAKFAGIYCIALNPKADKLYITDLENRRIRVVDIASGKVDLVAGNGEKGVPKDGADAKTSPLVDPRACAADSKGNVYILERGGHALRVVDAQGRIRTVVGTGKAGLSGDGGPALEATLKGPKHLCIDGDDNVLIADTANHVIRKYTPKDGKIIRLAGTGKLGSSGTGGTPLDISFNEPHGVTLHPKTGELYIVDSMNHRVFRWEK